MRASFILAGLIAAAAVTSSHAWPTGVDVPNLAHDGVCPAALVMINSSETLMSSQVRGPTGGTCRFSGFHRLEGRQLTTAVRGLPRRPIYIQATSGLPYESLMRVMVRIQDAGNYAVILSNIPLENS